MNMLQSFALPWRTFLDLPRHYVLLTQYPFLQALQSYLSTDCLMTWTLVHHRRRRYVASGTVMVVATSRTSQA